MVKRFFRFTFYKVGKYEKRIPRDVRVMVNAKDDEDIGIVAHRATNNFTVTIGSLKWNEIICIQEEDEKGNPIGEKIVPDSDSSIVPVG